MKMYGILAAAAAGTMIFFAATTVPGQVPPESPPAISVSGTSTVRRLPEAVRIMIPVLAVGKTAGEAFANLEAERKSAIEKVERLGIAGEGVSFENFGTDLVRENRRRQMQTMIAQRMRQQPNRKKTPPAPDPVMLRCLLVVEQPLSGKTEEEILKESCEWTQKIKAADFSPKAKALSPEEEEMAEEMAGMHYHSGEEQNADAPRFVYVSKITEEEARNACTEAFREARKQGETLAAAAGVKAGALVHLSSSLSKSPANANPFGNHAGNYYVAHMMGTQQFGGDGGKQLEGQAATPDTMAFAFTVQALFAMEK